MTIYRGMDIGTAKPTAAERARVPHHGLDLAEPAMRFSATQWLAEAERVITDCQARGVPLVAVGGTPMYWKMLLEGVFEGPAADPALRAELEAQSAETLRAELERVDPVSAERLHLNDQRRTVRAVEVYRLTGKPISAHQTQWEQNRTRHAIRLFGLRWDRPALNRRINARAKQMIADGWVEEVRHLLATGGIGPTAAEAVGYRHLIEHVEGRLPLADALEQVKIKSRQLGVKQMRWFRRFPTVRWLDAETADANAVLE
jgi:tRNA dimethylallyltransferase